MRPLPEVHLCEPEHLADPEYEDMVEGARSRMLRNTLLALVLPWLVLIGAYVGWLFATGEPFPF